MTKQKVLVGALAALFVVGISMTLSKDGIAQTPTVEVIQLDYVNTGGARVNDFPAGQSSITYAIIPGNRYFLTDIIFSNTDGIPTCGRLGKQKRDASTSWRTSKIAVPAEGSVVIQLSAPIKYVGGEAVIVQNCSDGGGDINWMFHGVNTVPSVD